MTQIQPLKLILIIYQPSIYKEVLVKPWTEKTVPNFPELPPAKKKGSEDTI